MQTRAAAKKENTDEDDGGSVTWDAESIFDPPQRNSKSHEFDSKIGSKTSGIASSNPLFSPLEKPDDDDALSFKPSLSEDMDNDSSFSDYLNRSQQSLKGSPIARSPISNDLQLGIPFPSPLHDINDKDAQIMNDALNMSFDFNENSAAMGTMNSSSSERMGFNFPRLTPSNSSFSLNTPPRSVPNMGHPHDLKKEVSTAAAFPADTAPNFGTPSHYTPARPIYDVPSRCPSKCDSRSHTTPDRSQQEKYDDIADKSPEFSPPRTKIRTKSPGRSGSIKSSNSSSPSQRHQYHHPDGILPVKNNSSDLCVTPSPSHSQSRISKAVSDESNTPPAMLQYPPSTIHPMNYHHSTGGTPSSASYPNSGEAGIPHPPSYTSPNWSNSLHLAPLPPFVSSNGAPPTPQWQHPGGVPTQGNAAAPYGYPQYSPYYPQHQTTPPRCSNPQSTKDSSAEAAHWRQKHHLLYQFRAKFGHCRVPPRYGVGTEYEGLFEWVMDQHYQHQRMLNGEVTTMTPTRARVLADIGVVFAQMPYDSVSKSPSNSNDHKESKAPSSWSNWMSQLAEYRRKHGDCDVPLKYAANPALGAFVNRQRAEYRKMLAKKPSSMTEERVNDLNRLGFTWAVKESHTSWQERFEDLKAYMRENGHTNVPKIYPKNPSLGYWVSFCSFLPSTEIVMESLINSLQVNEQRFQYRRLQKNKSSCMTEDKIKALNSIDFKFTLREASGSWQNWLKQLQAYKDEHGNVDVPLKYKPNLALGAFVNRQRTEYRKLKQGLQSSLTDKRINDLNSMGFKWTIRVSRTPWEKRLRELKEFKAKYGHTNVPSAYPPNQPLAYWIFKQRGQYRIYMKNLTSGLHDEDKPLSHMTPERIRMLNEIGFEWNPPRRLK